MTQPRYNKPWSAAETAELLRMNEMGRPLTEMAEKAGRSTNAARKKLAVEGQAVRIKHRTPKNSNTYRRIVVIDKRMAYDFWPAVGSHGFDDPQGLAKELLRQLSIKPHLIGTVLGERP